MSRKFDVVVIGAGPAGYVAAIRAAQHGNTVLDRASGLDPHPLHNWHRVPHDVEAITVKRHGPQGAAAHEDQVPGVEDAPRCGVGHQSPALPSVGHEEVELAGVRPQA